MSRRPSAAERLGIPDAVLTRTDLLELGYERRAIDSVFRACPTQHWPGYTRPVILVSHFLAARARFTRRDELVPPIRADS